MINKGYIGDRAVAGDRCDQSESNDTVNKLPAKSV